MAARRTRSLEPSLERLEGQVQRLEGPLRRLEGQVRRLEGQVRRLEGQVRRVAVEQLAEPRLERRQVGRGVGDREVEDRRKASREGLRRS
eukprot:693001-Pyramimonas_sp.AAC.1